jgi:hypothetical protein
MRYLLMIYTNEAQDANQTEAERTEEYQAYTDFGTEVAKRGMNPLGEALHPTNTATTVRVRNGKTLTTDGPFAETHEALGGFYLLDCKDLDEAIEMAAKIPGAKNGSIEIRPTVVFD